MFNNSKAREIILLKRNMKCSKVESYRRRGGGFRGKSKCEVKEREKIKKEPQLTFGVLSFVLTQPVPLLQPTSPCTLRVRLFY